jgi:hypothetical protein
MDGNGGRKSLLLLSRAWYLFWLNAFSFPEPDKNNPDLQHWLSRH